MSAFLIPNDHLHNALQTTHTHYLLDISQLTQGLQLLCNYSLEFSDATAGLFEYVLFAIVHNAVFAL